MSCRDAISGGGGLRLPDDGRRQHRLRLPPERRLPARQLDVCRCFPDGALRRRPGAVLVEIPLKSRLRALRAERAWSQGDLARHLRVSRQTVNAIETEKYEPSLSLAFRIARLFRMHIEDVFESPAT